MHQCKGLVYPAIRDRPGRLSPRKLDYRVGFSKGWVIKPTPNGWTDNETGLEWIQHFNKHTKPKREADYRMLILDGHESHNVPGPHVGHPLIWATQRHDYATIPNVNCPPPRWPIPLPLVLRNRQKSRYRAILRRLRFGPSE
jgi:hypothetical protein